MSYTKGKWQYIVEILDAGGWKIPQQFITIFTGDTIIAYYDTAAMEYPKTDEENKANARLIAAAPDLLEAAIKVVKIQTTSGAGLAKAIDKLDKAIAKAKGKS